MLIERGRQWTWHFANTLTNRRYKGYKQRHAARLFPHFRRIRLKTISFNEIYVLVAYATLESIKFKYPFKRTTEQNDQRILKHVGNRRRGDLLTFQQTSCCKHN